MIDYVKPRKDYKENIRDYVYKVGGKYQITKNRKYYGRYNSREDAKKVSDELKRLGWDKENLKEAQRNANVKPSSPYFANTTGYAHVTKQNDSRIKQGFLWVYSYRDDGTNKRISSTSLKELEKRVVDKGLEWRKL